MTSPRLEYTLQLVKRVYDMFRPRFYNRVTWFVVVSGVTIASSDLVDWLFRAALGVTIDVQVTDGSDALVGMVLVVAGLLYHLTMTFIERVGESPARESHRSEKRSHDLDVFKRTDGLLNERQYNEILDWIGSDHSMPEQGDLLDRYLFAFEGVENSYLIDDLEESKCGMVSSLNELRWYMAQHFFDYNNRSCLDPEINPDRGGLYATEEDVARYHAQARELVVRVRNARDAYARYRESVRDVLSV